MRDGRFDTEILTVTVDNNPDVISFLQGIGTKFEHVTDNKIRVRHANIEVVGRLSQLSRYLLKTKTAV